MNRPRAVSCVIAAAFVMGMQQLALAAKPIPLERVKATASSVFQWYVAGNAVDGKISDASRWVSAADQPGTPWLQLEWAKVTPLQGLHVYSGWKAGNPVNGLRVEYRRSEGDWVEIPSAAIHGNTSVALAIPFDTTVKVETDALRLRFTDTKDGRARIKEVVIWPESQSAMPPASGQGFGAVAEAGTPRIYLNQSGFNLGKPKRFTAPTLPDGTAFSIHPAKGGDALFTGTINKHLGDFSEFNPRDSQAYVVQADGETSVPFTIGLWRLERITYQPAIDFMVDSRHYVGNYKGVCRGSFGWRDDHHFAWVLRALVPQYLSNPAAYDRMPRQIAYVEPLPGRWGALEPYKEEAPDIVKMIHWGADVTVTQQLTHEFLKGELAFFLHAWPALKQWLPRQNYDVVLKYVQDHWQESKADRGYPYDTSPEHNLFALKTKLGTTKGELPPGHGIMPNLLMYDVAKRDSLPEAQKYFDAAYRQVEWIVNNLDWEDPQTTKGQRMSEHITMTSLAAFLQLHPHEAPKGLKKKIQDWATIVLRRSDNMWDFRRFTDDGQWTPSGQQRTMWNEPGNVVGLPAALLAARPFVDDPHRRARFMELAWSHMDNCFGRNPCGRHFSYDAPREVEGVEHGWYSYLQGGIGRLADARFVLDGAPKHVHYPYNPGAGNYGWTEGWVNFNTAFNVSLAYMARADTTLHLQQEGETIVVRLQAPLNFDPNEEEPVTLTVQGRTAAADTLTEASPGSPEHVGRVSVLDLGAKPGDTVRCSYGFGYMAREAKLALPVKRRGPPIDTSLNP